jgi:hypothetical protein
LGFAVIVLILYIIMNSPGIFRLFNYFPTASENMGYAGEQGNAYSCQVDMIHSRITVIDDLNHKLKAPDNLY